MIMEHNFFKSQLIFMIQVSHLIGDILKPTKTLTNVEEVKLQDFDFPINVKICLRPGFNITALQKLGYRNFLTYVLGLSSFNSSQGSSLFGWGGHTNDSRDVTSARGVLDAITTNARDLIQIINVVTREDKVELVWAKNLKRINWLDECHILDLKSLEMWRPKEQKES